MDFFSFLRYDSQHLEMFSNGFQIQRNHFRIQRSRPEHTGVRENRFFFCGEKRFFRV